MNKRQKKMHMIPYFEGIRKTMYFSAHERIHFVPFHATWFDFMYIMNESCPNEISRKNWNKLYKMYNRKYYFTDYQRKFIQDVLPRFRQIQDIFKAKNAIKESVEKCTNKNKGE